MENTSKSNKVSRACDRCRKQKLKCDVERPCILCVRRNITCSDTIVAVHSKQTLSTSPGRSKKRRLSRPDSRRGPTPTSPASHVRTSRVSGPNSQAGPEASATASGESSDLDVLRSSTIQGEEPEGTTSNEPRGRNGAGLLLNSMPALSNNRASSTGTFANDSSPMGLTTKIFNLNESRQVTTSALPGGAPVSPSCQLNTAFLEVLFPPVPVVEALVDSYFDTVHWFMFILHEPSFRARTKHVISIGPWMKTPEDADFAALLLMVIALGAQYAGTNPDSRFKPLMAEHSVDLGTLALSCIRQVRSHLLDSLEHCQIEAVQTCVLLGTYYIYHGNPNLSWSVLGLAVKSSYALGMHREIEWKGDRRLLQSRKRAWWHTYIADTFAAVIYGRPSTVDRSFCDISHPDDFDDTGIPGPLGTYLRTMNDGHPVSKLSYHSCKYVLYDIKAQIISNIYTLRARASFQATSGGIQKLVNLVHAFDKKLKYWHDSIPSFFKRIDWTSGDEDPADVFKDLHETLPESQQRIKEHLIMQTVALQLLYDYILILLHRPLLEYRMSSQKSGRRPSTSRDPFPNSFEACVNAALRISHAPADKFKYHCPMALITMHMFTAGVILCMPATMDPFSTLAHETKGAVVKMIRMFKKLSSQSPVVAQSCTLLEELMKVVLKRELDLILRPEEQSDASSSDVEAQQAVPSAATSEIAAHPTPNQQNHNECCKAPRDAPQAVGGGFQDPLVPSTSANTTTFQSYQSRQSGLSENTVSPEAQATTQSQDFIDAELNLGFTDAFGALEKVIYDFAPSEWINPAWMHSYESADAFAGSQFGFGYGEPPQNSGLGNNGSYYYEMGEYSMGDLYGSNVGDGSAS